MNRPCLEEKMRGMHACIIRFFNGVREGKVDIPPSQFNSIQILYYFNIRDTTHSPIIREEGFFYSIA